MTEDMRERGVQSKWNELFVVETDRGEWIDMAGEGGWSAFSLLSEAQEIADSEDEPCKIVRFVRQAALSSAGTSQPNIQSLLDQLGKIETRQWRDEHGREIKGALWIRRDDVAEMLMRASAGTSGTAALVDWSGYFCSECNVEATWQPYDEVHTRATCPKCMKWQTVVERRGDSLSGKGEATPKCPTCGSKERDARHALATDSPNIDLCPDKWHTASAPDRAEELAQDKFAELRSFLTNMRRDAADAEDPELSEYAQAIEQRLDELASLLREAEGRSSAKEERRGK